MLHLDLQTPNEEPSAIVHGPAISACVAAFCECTSPVGIPVISLSYLHFLFNNQQLPLSLALCPSPRRAALPLPSSPAPSPSPLGDNPFLFPVCAPSSSQRPPVTSLPPLSLDPIEAAATDPSRSSDARDSLSCSEIRPRGFRQRRHRGAGRWPYRRYMTASSSSPGLILLLPRPTPPFSAQI